MATLAGPLVDIILQRVRDPQGLTHTRAFVRTILTHIQRAVNARQRYLVSTSTLTTQPYKAFYPIAPLVTTGIRVTGVRDANESLEFAPWMNFWYMHQGWHRKVGGRLQAWSLIGRDLLVLWPVLDRVSSVTLVHPTLTADVIGDGHTLEIPDEAMPLLTELCEVVLLAVQRDFPPVELLLKTLPERLKESMTDAAR